MLGTGIAKARVSKGRPGVARPSSKQVAVAEAVVRWYVATHFRRADEPGTPALLFDPRHVGDFAVDRARVAAGDPQALFKLLVAMAMFQRRQDVQIMRILRGLSPRDAAELSSSTELLRLADLNACRESRSNASLLGSCDLAKDEDTGAGCCTANPRVNCYLKRHTVLLKRYGHFGKVPTSIALAVREAGATDLPGLRAQILGSIADPAARAEALERALCAAWRVNQKIACMFLSAVCNPDVSPGAAPWSEDVDWTKFVVVDSNVDLFLKSIKYQGLGTYDARRAFIVALAEDIDLGALDARLRSYNPRIVQQAFYVFMSATNRRATTVDCMRAGVAACRACPRSLRDRCLVRTL